MRRAKRNNSSVPFPGNSPISVTLKKKGKKEKEECRDLSGFQWRTGSHLVDDLPSLQHVKPLGQSTVLHGGDISHFIHHHRTQGLLLNQDLCCRQPVLQAPVPVDVEVVGKGPTI